MRLRPDGPRLLSSPGDGAGQAGEALPQIVTLQPRISIMPPGAVPPSLNVAATCTSPFAVTSMDPPAPLVVVALMFFRMSTGPESELKPIFPPAPNPLPSISAPTLIRP